MKTIVLVLLVASCSVHASFNETSRRYLSPRDTFNLIEQKFPVLRDIKKLDSLPLRCWAIHPRNANAIGVKNPALGAPVSDQPSLGFVRWLGSCVGKIAHAQFEDLEQQTDTKLFAIYFPAEILAKYKNSQAKSEPYLKFLQRSWTAVTEEERSAIVKHIIEEFIGPAAVLKDSGVDLQEIAQRVIESVDQKKTVGEVTAGVVLATAMREEFLSY